MANTKPTKSYKELSKELDEILEWFESGEHNIDEALPNYEAAMKLLQQLESYLEAAENKIKKINLSLKNK